MQQTHWEAEHGLAEESEFELPQQKQSEANSDSIPSPDSETQDESASASTSLSVSTSEDPASEVLSPEPDQVEERIAARDTFLKWVRDTWSEIPQEEWKELFKHNMDFAPPSEVLAVSVDPFRSSCTDSHPSSQPWVICRLEFPMSRNGWQHMKVSSRIRVSLCGYQVTCGSS